MHIWNCKLVSWIASLFGRMKEQDKNPKKVKPRAILREKKRKTGEEREERENWEKIERRAKEKLKLCEPFKSWP